MSQFVRLTAASAPEIAVTVDGRPVLAGAGDSVLTAILLAGDHVRHSEFTGEKRAGFCLMGACQDCWVWTEQGLRLRGCTTIVQPGMRLLTAPPAGWPHV